MSDGTVSDAAEPRPAVEVRRGHPTDEELAAVVAVVDEAWAQEKADATAPAPARRSRWALSARGLRTPLDRDAGWVGPVG